MPQPRRRVPGWSEEESAAFHARFAALMAEVHADEEAGRHVAREWLAGRVAESWSSDGWFSIRTDGFSVFHSSGSCTATWVGGPRRLYDPDVALLSGQRLRAGSFAIRAWYGVREVLEERAVPNVLVRPPVPKGIYRTNPVDFVRGWEHSQAVVHMLETGEHRQAAKELVWAWIHDDDAQFRRPWCRAHVYAKSIIADHAAIVTWAPKVRVALLSKRRYALNTFRRIMRDSIRDALASYDVPVREVAPACSNVYVEPAMLVSACEQEGWHVS